VYFGFKFEAKIEYASIALLSSQVNAAGATRFAIKKRKNRESAERLNKASIAVDAAARKEKVPTKRAR
jgi:hypothetical protein